MKVLVTGGCGFVGINLICRLLASGRYAITVLDNLSTGSESALEEAVAGLDTGPGLVRLVKGDVRDLVLAEKACAGADTVVHLAAQTGVPGSLSDPFIDSDINVRGTLNMLEASRRAKVPRFIFASSNAALGAAPPPSRENTAPRPLSPYGASKLAGEGYCSAYRGSYGLDTVVLRFSNAYGPWSLHKTSVVARFIRDGLSRAALTVYGDGSQTRDFVHVSDIAEGIERILESRPHETPGIYQLGTGVETPVYALARLVDGLLPGRAGIVFKPGRPGEAERNYPDITKARETFGYDPRVTLEDGIAETLGWFAAKLGAPDSNAAAAG